MQCTLPVLQLPARAAQPLQSFVPASGRGRLCGGDYRDVQKQFKQVGHI